MHKGLHPRDNRDRQYVLWKEGRRGLSSIQDSVDTSIRYLEDYIKRVKKRLITATRNNTTNTSSNRSTMAKKQKWEEKQLYRHFQQQTSEISHEKTLTWLRKGNLKKETESLLIAAQNNAIRKEYKTWRDWSCIRNLNSTTRTNGICIIQNPSWWMRRTNFFGIETDHLISARRPNLVIVNKKKNGIRTTQNPSRRMRSTNLSGILRNKRII